MSHLIPLATVLNGATKTDMHPEPLLVAVGLLLDTAGGALVRLPCCGALVIESEGLALAVADGLDDGLKVG